MSSTREDFIRWQAEQKRAEELKERELKKEETIKVDKVPEDLPTKQKRVQKSIEPKKEIKIVEPEVNNQEKKRNRVITKEKTLPKISPKAQTQKSESQKTLDLNNYIVRESKYGLGLGVTGLGRMVHLEEKINKEGMHETFYRLRKEQEKPRILSNDENSVVYKEDLYQTSTPRIATALIEEIINIYSKRINATLKNPILMKDVFNYLLLKELKDEKTKTILLEALIGGKSNSNLEKLFKWDKENKSVTDKPVDLSVNLQDLLIQSIDRQNNAISEMARQNKVLQEQNERLSEQLYGVTRTLAYQEGVRNGLVTASHLTSTEELLGALATDETTRVVNAIHETGSNEMKRQKTIRNYQVRNTKN